MKRLLRWIGIALGGLVGLGIVAYAVLYVLSERVLRRTYEAPAVSLTIPTDPASIMEGRRLATVRGCFADCHGKQAEGKVMFDQPMIARVVAPNLTAAVHKYSDAELVAIIRNGVRPGGRSLLIMPSDVFVVLTDEDLGRIIAFLKSLPVVEGPGQASRQVRSGVLASPPANSSWRRSSSPKPSRLRRRLTKRLLTDGILLGPSAPSATVRLYAAIPIPISAVPICGWSLPIHPTHSANCCEQGSQSGKETLA